jgi:hypothetical protein
MTGSVNYPVVPGAFCSTFNGGWDGYITKLENSGSSLLYSTYFGGTSREWISDVVLETQGNVFATGWTESSDFPTTKGVFQDDYAGQGDGFVLSLNKTGGALLWSSFLGGKNEWDRGSFLDLDVDGNIYVLGATNANDFPCQLRSLPQHDCVFIINLS